MTNRSVREILLEIRDICDLNDNDTDMQYEDRIDTVHHMAIEALATDTVDPWHRKGAGWTPETLPVGGCQIVIIKRDGLNQPYAQIRHTAQINTESWEWIYAWMYLDLPAVDAGGKDGAA